MGKTALGLNIAANLVLAKKPEAVLFFSLEMNKHAVMQRLIATQAAVSLNDVRSGFFGRGRWKDLTKAAAGFAEAPLYLNDSPGLSLVEIATLSRQLAVELRRKGKNLGLILIDYLQLIRWRPSGRSRREQVVKIVRGLKQIATELNVPVLVLSQVKRRVELRDRHDQRPRLEDIPESPAIAQSADLIAFLYRDGYYRPSSPSLERKAELILAKNTRGNTGVIPLEFLREYTLFKNASN